MKGTMRIMDQTGDTVIDWETENEEQVARTKQVFDDFLSRNYTAYRTGITKGVEARSTHEGQAPGDSTPAGTSSTVGELIKHFDPNAAEIIIAVPLIGG